MADRGWLRFTQFGGGGPGVPRLQVQYSCQFWNDEGSGLNEFVSGSFATSAGSSPREVTKAALADLATRAITVFDERNIWIEPID